MRSTLKPRTRFAEVLIFGALCAACISLSVFRYLYSDTTTFLFLNWNLFLASIPWVLTSLLITMPRLRRNRVVMPAIVLTWLLFFPNAPYILTDLFHVRGKPPMPIWFDLVLVLSFAWTGLLLGISSLLDIERLLSSKMSNLAVACTTTLLLFTAGFGVYLGRFLRWNSWDILAQPSSLLLDVGDRFVNPLEHPRTWGMTLLLGLFLNAVFLSIKHLSRRPAQKMPSPGTEPSSPAPGR